MGARIPTSDDEKKPLNSPALPLLVVLLKQRTDRLKVGFQMLRALKAKLLTLDEIFVGVKKSIDQLVEITRRGPAFPKVEFTPGFLNAPISASSSFNATSRKPAPGFKPSPEFQFKTDFPKSNFSASPSHFKARSNQAAPGFKPSPGFEFRTDFPKPNFPVPTTNFNSTSDKAVDGVQSSSPDVPVSDFKPK